MRRPAEERARSVRDDRMDEVEKLLRVLIVDDEVSQRTGLAGMVNAYSKRLRTDYVYASDSNGYWRFKPIPDVIQERHNRLHILTHPEWWTPDPLPPRDRIERCVMGRAQANLQKYDTGLARFGRRNIGNSEDRS